MTNPLLKRRSPGSKKRSQSLTSLNDDLFQQLLAFFDPASFYAIAKVCQMLYQRMLVSSASMSLPYNLRICRNELHESKRVQNLALSRNGEWMALDDRSREGVVVAKLQSAHGLGSQTILHNRNSSGCISSLSLSVDGSYVAQCNSFGTVEVWDVKLQQLLASFETMIELESLGFGPCASLVKFVPPLQKHKAQPHEISQPLLATAGSDRQLRVWRLCGALKLEFPTCRNKITCLDTSASGMLAVTGGGNGWSIGELKLWNVTTGQCVHNFVLQGPQIGSIHKVSVSDSGDVLAASGEINSKYCSLLFWDHQQLTKQPIKEHVAEAGATTPSATANVASLQTQPILVEGHSSWVNCCSINPKGDAFVSGSHDGTVKLWYISRENAPHVRPSKSTCASSLPIQTSDHGPGRKAACVQCIKTMTVGESAQSLLSGAHTFALSENERLPGEAAAPNAPMYQSIQSFSKGGVNWCAWSDDGKRLISQSDGNELSLWSSASPAVHLNPI